MPDGWVKVGEALSRQKKKRKKERKAWNTDHTRWEEVKHDRKEEKETKTEGGWNEEVKMERDGGYNSREEL